jgi:hypothetical protein
VLLLAVADRLGRGTGGDKGRVSALAAFLRPSADR